MIKAIHIEDEINNVQLLKNLLKQYCSNQVFLAGDAGNVSNAYQLIIKEKPQLVFLDIELNQGNAFELLDKVQSTIGINFEIIFITAFNEYAIKAFKLHAIDYILKPISIQELVNATNKACEKIENKLTSENLKDLLNQVRQDNASLKIGLPVPDGLVFVRVNEIVSIEAKGNITHIYLVNKSKIISSKTLKEIETLLPDPQFLRIHNSWIVNRNLLKKYFKGKAGYVEMEDGSLVPVSIRKKSDLLDKF